MFRRTKAKHYSLLPTRRGPALHGPMGTRAGSLLIDALLAIAIFGVIVAAFSAGLTGGQQGPLRGGHHIRATSLAEEGLEAARSIRDRTGFAALPPNNQDNGVKPSGTNWVFDGTQTTIDGTYTRKIVLSAGPNANTRKVTATVTWTESPGNQTLSLSLETYLTNWRTGQAAPSADWSLACIEGRYAAPSLSDFTDILIDGTSAYVSDNAADGFYIFNIADPNNPQLVRSELINDGLGYHDVAKKDTYAYVAHGYFESELVLIDLATPGGISTKNIAGDNSAIGFVRLGNKLYVARNNDPTGNEYLELDITNASSPIEIAGRGVNMDDRTSNAIALNGGFAYLATNHVTEDLTVVDANQNPPVKSGATNIEAGTAGISVAATSAAVYMGMTADYPYELYAFDISSSPGNPPAPGNYGGYSASGGGEVRDIAISGTPPVAFIATNSKSGGGEWWYFQAIDLSDPLSIEHKQLAAIDMTAGCPATGHMCNAGDGAKGIAFRPAGGPIATDTVYLVGERYLLVIKPGGCTP